MASLGTRQACTPAEVLRASQGYHQLNCTQRAKTAVLPASTWNVHVRSMVDTEDPVEEPSQRSNGQRGEDRKKDQIVLEGIMFLWGHCKRQNGLVMRSMKCEVVCC